MKITFLGADRTVTGSCHMLEVNGKKILFDCGMFQGPKIIRDLNQKPFLFNPGEIDAVVLSHAHIDHSGLLPKLVRDGFKGSIHCTKVTEELSEILLPDCGHIQESDAETATRKGLRAGKPAVTPLYTADDAFLALKHFVSHDFNEDFEIAPGVKIRFRIAGHILGSAMVNIFVTENGKETKILFTGDIGQPNVPIIDDPYQVAGADFVITESTYGNRVHEVGDREQELLDIMQEALAKGGNIIIPAFAVGRTQVMLYYFQKMMRAKMIPEIPIYVDSPMAIKATQVMLFNPEEYDEEAKTIYVEQGNKLIDMPNVTYTETPAESRAINDMPGTQIIISASGMADAGRVLHHLKHNLWRKDSSVIFAGYQAEGSLGRLLTDGAKKVRIMGEEISVAATIYNMKGFSAHSDKNQMLALFKGMQKQPRAYFIVHGEYDAQTAFADMLRNEMGATTFIPNFGDDVLIDGTEWKVEESKIVMVEPQIQALRDYLRTVEKNYLLCKAKMEQIIIHDGSRFDEIKGKLDKIKKYIDDVLKTL